MDEKSCVNILIYDISHKTSIGGKPLRIWFKKRDGVIKIYHGIRYLVLFGSEQYNAIYNRIKYLISKKSGITDIISHNFARIRINSFPTEKALTFHNVIMLIKSVVNKNKKNFYYFIFLEKGSCEDKSNIQHF